MCFNTNMRGIVVGIIASIVVNQIACKSDDGNLWRFDVDVPEILRLIKKYTGLSISDAEKKKHIKLIERKGPDFLGKTVKLEITPPDFQGMFSFMKNMLGNRRNDFFSFVEMGPGYYKTPTEYYPKDYLKGKLLNLVRLQKDQQENEVKKVSTIDEYNKEHDNFD